MTEIAGDLHTKNKRLPVIWRSTAQFQKLICSNNFRSFSCKFDVSEGKVTNVLPLLPPFKNSNAIGNDLLPQNSSWDAWCKQHSMALLSWEINIPWSGRHDCVSYTKHAIEHISEVDNLSLQSRRSKVQRERISRAEVARSPQAQKTCLLVACKNW